VGVDVDVRSISARVTDCSKFGGNESKKKRTTGHVTPRQFTIVYNIVLTTPTLTTFTGIVSSRAAILLATQAHDFREGHLRPSDPDSLVFDHDRSPIRSASLGQPATELHAA
jgi:hypothetical protein